MRMHKNYRKLLAGTVLTIAMVAFTVSTVMVMAVTDNPGRTIDESVPFGNGVFHVDNVKTVDGELHISYGIAVDAEYVELVTEASATDMQGNELDAIGNQFVAGEPNKLVLNLPEAFDGESRINISSGSIVTYRSVQSSINSVMPKVSNLPTDRSLIPGDGPGTDIIDVEGAHFRVAGLVQRPSEWIIVLKPENDIASKTVLGSPGDAGTISGSFGSIESGHTVAVWSVEDQANVSLRTQYLWFPRGGEEITGGSDFTLTLDWVGEVVDAVSVDIPIHE